MSRIRQPTCTSRSQVEAGQPDLDGPRVVEPGIGLEIDVQPLGQRLQPLHALRAVVEGRRAGDHQVQARETSRVDLVDQLPQGIQALVAHVAADPLDGLHLVEHDQQARLARVAQDGQQALQEAQRPEVVDVAFDAGGTLGGGGDVRLPGQPGQQPIGRGRIALRPGPGDSPAAPH